MAVFALGRVKQLHALLAVVMLLVLLPPFLPMRDKGSSAGHFDVALSADNAHDS